MESLGLLSGNSPKVADFLNSADFPIPTPSFQQDPLQKALADLPRLDSFGIVSKPSNCLAPRVLVSLARGCQPWNLVCCVDHAGGSVEADFAVQSCHSQISANVLWAICSSPVANAYLTMICGSREPRAEDLRGLPVPRLDEVDLQPLERSVTAYPQAVLTNQMNLKYAHWRVDAEVLKLYQLEAKLERDLLVRFHGVGRPGVAFEQMGYFPDDFQALDRLSDFLLITADWDKINERRGELLDLEYLSFVAPEQNPMTLEQTEELARLQWLADAFVYLHKPVHIADAPKIIEDLKKRGLWNY